MSTTETTTKTYTVIVDKLAELQNRLAGLNKRAKRLGVPAITLTTGATSVKKITTTSPSGKEWTREIVLIEVTLTGQAPKIPGWALAAILQHEDGGTIIRQVPNATAEGELKKFRDVEPWCEHCKTTRRRAETFVVRREADRALLQVGRDCLADFLGHENPHHLAACAELLTLADELAEEAGDEGEGGWGMRSPTTIGLGTFLGVTIAAIRECGWLSRTKARETGRDGEATADRVLSHVFRSPTAPEVVRGVVEDDFTEAQRFIELVTSHFEATPADKLNDYEHNLRVVLLSGYASGKTGGIAASLIGYGRRLEAAEVEARLVASGARKHVGEIGKRATFLLTITRQTETENDFGIVVYVGMSDAEGNKLVWKSSGVPYALLLPKTGEEYEGRREKVKTGKLYEVVGTVKRQSFDRRDGKTPETWLTRCDVREVGMTEFLDLKKKADAKAKREAKKAEKKAKDAGEGAPASLPQEASA